MNYLVMADIHFKWNETLGLMVDGVNSRLTDKLKAFDFALNYGFENQVDFVVIVGDLFDSINPDEKLRALVSGVINKYLRKGLTIYYIIGNHDSNGLDNSCYMSEGEFASKEKFIIVRDEAKIIKGSPNLLMVPWMQEKYIREYNDRSDTVLFYHGMVDGSKADGGRHSLKSKVTQGDLKGFRRVELGDVHLRQSFNEIEGGYVGSLVCQNFGEREQGKGFKHVVIGIGLLKSDNEEFIESPDRKFHQIDWFSFEEFGDDSDGFLKIVFKGDSYKLRELNYKEIRERAEKQFYRVFFEKKIIDLEPTNGEHTGIDYREIFRELTDDKDLIEYVEGLIKEC